MSEPVQVLFVGDAMATDALRHRLAPLPVRAFDAVDRDPAAPCVILLPPGENLPAHVATLKGQAPGVPVVVALRAADAATLRDLLDAGADAVVAEGLDPVALRGAVTALVAQPAPTRSRSGAREDGDALTPRESEVLRLLSAGFSNKEVARRLEVSVRTVETHRLNLRRKTQTGRLRDLVQLARRLGLQPVVETAADRRGGVRAVAIGERQVGRRYG